MLWYDEARTNNRRARVTLHVANKKRLRLSLDQQLSVGIILRPIHTGQKGRELCTGGCN